MRGSFLSNLLDDNAIYTLAAREQKTTTEQTYKFKSLDRLIMLKENEKKIPQQDDGRCNTANKSKFNNFILSREIHCSNIIRRRQKNAFFMTNK